MAIVNKVVCREARFEAMKDTKNLTVIHLAGDITERRLFDFERDTLFVNTNAREYVMEQSESDYFGYSFDRSEGDEDAQDGEDV